LLDVLCIKLLLYNFERLIFYVKFEHFIPTPNLLSPDLALTWDACGTSHACFF